MSKINDDNDDDDDDDVLKQVLTYLRYR